MVLVQPLLDVKLEVIIQLDPPVQVHEIEDRVGPGIAAGFGSAVGRRVGEFQPPAVETGNLAESPHVVGLHMR